MSSKFKRIFPAKYIILIIVLSIIMLLFAGVFFMLNAPKISQEAYGQYYTISNINISTISYVLNEKRNVTKMIVGASDEEEYKQFTYSNTTSIKTDIRSFVDYLIQSEDFEIIEEKEPDSLMWWVMLSKHDLNNKKNVVVEISCEVNRYIITLKVGKDNE